jgi:hypothetical protein
MFLNAWNEWAEGTYLESDWRFGYAYLHAVANALGSKTPASPKKSELVRSYTLPASGKTAGAVICVHIFYPDLIVEIDSSIALDRIAIDLDVFITAPTTWYESPFSERCQNYVRLCV